MQDKKLPLSRWQLSCLIDPNKGRILVPALNLARAEKPEVNNIV